VDEACPKKKKPVRVSTRVSLALHNRLAVLAGVLSLASRRGWHWPTLDDRWPSSSCSPARCILDLADGECAKASIAMTAGQKFFFSNLISRRATANGSADRATSASACRRAQRLVRWASSTAQVASARSVGLAFQVVDEQFSTSPAVIRQLGKPAASDPASGYLPPRPSVPLKSGPPDRPDRAGIPVRPDDLSQALGTGAGCEAIPLQVPGRGLLQGKPEEAPRLLPSSERNRPAGSYRVCGSGASL